MPVVGGDSTALNHPFAKANSTWGAVVPEDGSGEVLKIVLFASRRAHPMTPPPTLTDIGPKTRSQAPELQRSCDQHTGLRLRPGRKVCRLNSGRGEKVGVVSVGTVDLEHAAKQGVILNTMIKVSRN